MNTGAPRPIWPNELLRLAGELAGENAGSGRLGTTRLRRAISTAYYAVFHELVIQATRELVGDRGAVKRGGTSPATRWFGHNDLRRLAEAVTGPGGKHRAISPVLGDVHSDVVRVAEAFVALQEARERADYDHNYDVRRRDARYYVAQARDAVATARRLYQDQEPSYVRFLRLMVGAVGIAKER